MYAKDFDIDTAVRIAFPAGNTFSTGDIRHYSEFFSRFKNIRTFYKLNGQFMSQHSGIRKIRLGAVKSMDIRTAYANLPDPDYGFPS
jgi:hypothetical protein